MNLKKTLTDRELKLLISFLEHERLRNQFAESYINSLADREINRILNGLCKVTYWDAKQIIIRIEGDYLFDRIRKKILNKMK